MTDSRIIKFPPSEVNAEPEAPRDKSGDELESLSDTDLVVLGKSCGEATHSEIIRVLLKRHSAKIRALAYTLARDAGPISREEFAEEVVFRFKVKLLEGLLRRRLESEKANGTAYLMRVVRTTALDYYREVEGRRKDTRALPIWTLEGFIARVFEPAESDAKADPRWMPVPIEELAGLKAESPRANDPAAILERTAQRELIKSVLKEAHQELGGNKVDIFLRYAVDGYTFEEIEKYLDDNLPAKRPHSRVTVRRHYHKACAVLRRLFESRGYGPRG